jgi:uncharacterized protein YcbX
MTLHIASLTIYPVKGLGGIPVAEAEVTPRGLAGDRRWMIVDAGTLDFVSQRTHPAMARLRTSLSDGILALSLATGADASQGSGVRQEGGVRLPAAPRVAPADPLSAAHDPTRLRVTVWDDPVEAVAPSLEADAWLSEVLGTAVRLVYQPESARRDTDPRWAPGHEVSLADGYPLLVIGQSSLDALNRLTPQPIPMDRFRPNVVVAATPSASLPPHDEDLWQRFQLGGVACAGVKCCARCSVTTVDQGTGIRGKEPLRTLATYRSWDGKVWFGQNVVPLGGGWLRVNDPVRVDERGAVGPCPPLPEPPGASQSNGDGGGHLEEGRWSDPA